MDVKTKRVHVFDSQCFQAPFGIHSIRGPVRFDDSEIQIYLSSATPYCYSELKISLCHGLLRCNSPSNINISFVLVSFVLENWPRSTITAKQSSIHDQEIHSSYCIFTMKATCFFPFVLLFAKSFALPASDSLSEPYIVLSVTCSLIRLRYLSTGQTSQ